MLAPHLRPEDFPATVHPTPPRSAAGCAAVRDNADVDPAMVRQLTSDEGWRLLQSLPPYEETTALALQDRLRDAGFAAELVSAALTQSRLRSRAVHKFGEFAVGMLFTSDGLEQATRLDVAVQHAQRFARAGIRQVHDLTCGIGADAVVMSASGSLTVRARDADELSAAVAVANLRFWPASSARVARAEDFRPADAAGAGHGVWLDPARRTPGVTDLRGRTRRVFDLGSITPSWRFVQEVAAAVPATGAKLSPSFPHPAIPPGTQAQWVSHAGEVVECSVWWGPLAQHRGRSALVLAPDRLPCLVVEAHAGEAEPLDGLPGLGPWLYEPDKAVIRAGLTAALAHATGGRELDPGVGYVSAERAVDVRYARRYAVLEAMPYNVKALRAWVRDHRVSRLTIKKRGVGIDPEVLRRQLRLPSRGGEETTMVLTRVRGAAVVLVVRPA